MGEPKKYKSTGVNEIMLVVVVVFVGWVVLQTIFGPQGRRATPGDLDRAVLNNLRQLATGADQYYLDHGVTSVSWTDLVGTRSTQYVKPFLAIANETYPSILVKGQPVTAAGVASARTVTYGN